MVFLLYLVQASLYAAIMWCIYFIIWRNTSLHTYSRMYLLAGLVLPAVLPFIRIPVAAHTAAVSYSAVLPEIRISTATQIQQAGTFSLPVLLVWLYAAGCTLLAALYIRTYIRINKKLKHGNPVKYDDYTIITGTAIGPGTIGRKIFFPAEQTDNIIVQHELAHIRSGHRFDVLLLQILHIFFWISPAHWLLGKELKMVHEFEADLAASENIDMAAYASLLLSQSFGTPHSFTTAHSFFHHSLKRRIMMLQKTKRTKRIVLLSVSLTLTAGLIGMALLAQAKRTGNKTPATPVYAEAAANYTRIALNTPRPGEVKILDDGSIVFKTVEQMPQFKGNMYGWLSKNLHYPDVSRVRKEWGEAVVQFTVDENGQVTKPRLQRSSGYWRLDNEAIRVISCMPAWKPGIQKGKPAAVFYTLPVSFSLDGKAQTGC
ncbi:TonB family protein [Chitinophagaceae bacterium MMS25-I14]